MRLEHRYEGGCRYIDDAEIGVHRLVVAIPCLVGHLIDPHDALLDTASHWCVLPPSTASALGSEPGPGEPPIRMSTRLGVYEGWLDRIRLELPAVTGVALSIQATWFVAPDWPGPMVLGWKGCLERIRWAVDPGEQAFYFRRL